MLKIYHAKGTCGVRPIWFCEERGLPYEIEVVDLSPECRPRPVWRALSPTGKVPVMTDRDLTMFESGAMVDYLVANTFGIADIMTGYTLALASHPGMVPDDYPNSEAYVARLRERPRFRAASAAS